MLINKNASKKAMIMKIFRSPNVSKNFQFIYEKASKLKCVEKYQIMEKYIVQTQICGMAQIIIKNIRKRKRVKNVQFMNENILQFKCVKKLKP